MKIEKVHIKNIKGIKDLELSFRKDNKILDVIVLAGVNGSGKTTILESIKDFFYNKNIDYDILEKSKAKLKIFFEDFEEQKIKEAENFSDANKNKLSDFFNALKLYSFDKNEKRASYEIQIVLTPKSWTN